MLILADTNDKLQLVSGQAADLDVVTSFVTLNGTTVTPGKQLTAITTATTTDIVAVPGASDYKNVKSINVRNKDTADSCDVTIVFDDNGTDYELFKATLRPGEVMEYVEGVGFYVIPVSTVVPTLLKCLSADATGQNIATVQPWFPTTGAVTVAANTTYEFRGHLHMTRAAGTTSHTTGISFGGTATLTSIQWMAQCGEGEVATFADSDIIVGVAASNLQVKGASNSATEVVKLTVEGIVRINATGTFKPEFTYSATPGGAPTIKANSFFRMDILGTGTATEIGTWA